MAQTHLSFWRYELHTWREAFVHDSNTPRGMSYTDDGNECLFFGNIKFSQITSAMTNRVTVEHHFELWIGVIQGEKMLVARARVSDSDHT